LATVSIVLTSYNHAKFLHEAIDSVINQTFTNWELFIWDDVSSDSSWEIIQSYSDPRIKAIRNDRTRRYIYAINETITKLASGKYIAIHHSDDGWEPEKLAQQVAYLDAHPEVDAAFTHVQVIDENNKKIENNWFNEPNKSRTEWLRSLFLNTNKLCHPSALVRRDAYIDAGLYKLAHAQSDDAEMWSRLLLRSEIHVIPRKLTRHRIFTDNSSVSGNKPSVQSRLQFEWFVQKNNFTELSLSEILSIFPEAKQWLSNGEGDSRFLLAMAAIKLGNCQGTRLFGLNLLYKLLTNEADAAAIHKLHNFDYLNFFSLTGEDDIFVRTIQQKSETVSEEEVSAKGAIFLRIIQVARKVKQIKILNKERRWFF